MTPDSIDEDVATECPAITVDLLIEQVVDRLYERLGRAETIVTLRPLLADGARLPLCAAQWRAAAIEPRLAAIERLVRCGVRQGSVRDRVPTHASWLLLAAGIYAVSWQLVYEEQSPSVLAEQKRRTSPCCVKHLPCDAARCERHTFEEQRRRRPHMPRQPGHAAQPHLRQACGRRHRKPSRTLTQQDSLDLLVFRAGIGEHSRWQVS